MTSPTIIRPFARPRAFLDLQRRFYRDDPHYVPPMTAVEAWQVDPRNNPWFDHGRAQFLVAERDGEPVGRISAAADDLHDEFHGDRVGFFGHFEATDEAAAHALLREAEAWARQHSRTVLRGPVDLSTNYRCGLLVEGEPGPPVIMMPHNPPIYADWLRSWGLEKAKDLLAITMDSRDFDLKRWQRLEQRIATRAGATVRAITRRHFAREVDVLWGLYHRIWQHNWGFAPMSEREFRRQAADLKRIADPTLILILEVHGVPAGFIIGLPDANPAIRAANGRLFPLGFWRYLREFKRTQLTRVITLGVLPEHQRKGLETLLMQAITRNSNRVGKPLCDSSWILEDNEMMIRPLMDQLGGRIYRRYRIFEKALQ